MARRLCEAGVRFVQVTYGDSTANPAWDQHSNLPKHADHARAVDRPIAGLLADLKRRGLLEDTLVWWGGEFGRTPYAEKNGTGRDHNPDGFTVWLAGGGVKPGFAFGATDEFGHHAVQDKVHMHDLHATILHLLGLDHEKLTYRYSGRNFRLTDVDGPGGQGDPHMTDPAPEKPGRRPRYRGTNPRHFREKYKEHQPERYADDVAKVLAAGRTPAGTHRPVMVREILEVLAPRPGAVAVDCTLGYGGHARELLAAVQPGGRLIGVDADPIELPRTEARLRGLGFPPGAVVVRRMNFAGLAPFLAAEAPGRRRSAAGGPRAVLDADR